MIFEMITGDYLFNPRSGPNFTKDDDHLAQMMEIIGDFPKTFKHSGELSKQFFNKKSKLKRIRALNAYPLELILIEKFNFKEKIAKEIAGFLKPALEIDPKKRATAAELLNHPWLTSNCSENLYMSDKEKILYFQKKTLQNIQFDLQKGYDSEENWADNEFKIEDLDNFQREESLGLKLNRLRLDESFMKCYIGYGDGIFFEQLDQNKNCQFF